MHKSLYVALWLSLISLTSLFQPQTKTPDQIWDVYFSILQSKPTKALQELEEPITAARQGALQSSDEAQLLELTVLQMLVYNNQGKFGRSFEIYAALLKDDPIWLKSDPFFYKAFQYLGYHSNSRVNRKQDLPFLRTIAGTFGESSSTHTLFQALSLDLLGRTLYDQNQYQEAVDKLLQANTLIQKEKLKGFLSGNYTMLGIIYDAREDYRKAIEFYEQSNQVLGSLEPTPYGSMAVNAYNIGLIYMDRYGEVLKSLPYYEKALEYDRLDGGDKSPYLADDYRSLSNVYYRLFDYELAEAYIKRSIEHYKAYSYIENPSLATAYLSAAQLSAQKMLFDEALAYVEKAIEIYELNRVKNNTDTRRWMANAFNIRGNIAVKMGDLRAAVSAYQSSERISVDLDRTIFLMDAYRGLIKAHLLNNRPDLAFTTYQKWDDIIEEKLKDAPRFTFERRVSLSEILIEADSEETTTAQLDALIAALKDQKGMSDLYIRSLHAKTRAMLQNPSAYNDSYVLTHLEQYQLALVNDYNSKNGLFNKEQFNSMMKPSIVDALQLCFELNQARSNDQYVDWAFRLIDFNKSASLMEGLNVYKDQLSADLPTEIREEERVLEANRHSVLLKIQELNQQSKSDNSPLLEAYASYENINKRLDSLQTIIKQQYPSYFALSHVDPNAHLSEVVDHLEPNQTLVAYLMAPSQAFAITISKDTQKLHRLNDVSTLTQNLNQYRNDIIQRQTLNDSLLIHRLLPTNIDSLTNLVFIPDGALNGIPFETLPYQGKPLIHHSKVSYRTGFRFPAVSKSLGWKWHGFAPEYAERPLPSNQTEVENISKIVGGRTFIASKATKEHFLRHAPKATVIHLAAHGNINVTNPTSSSILFGDDPSQGLSVLEIYGLKLKGNLAVLSACNTGWSNTDIGDAWMSLSRAFAFAGVQSTLMSLWEVPDRETAIIMEAFYQHLRRGIPKDEALQQAKLDYLAQTADPALQHPYYWAGFVLSGDTQAFVPNPPVWIWFTPLVLILVLMYVRQYAVRKQMLIKGYQTIERL